MKIQKSFRKTTTLKVDKDGEIIVKASYFTSKKAILNFVEKHKDWIEKRQKEVLQSKKSFKEGEKFLYLGKEYYLQFDFGSKKLIFDGENFWLGGEYSSKVKEKFLEFYKKEAEYYIGSRLKYISKINGLNYNKVRITNARTRWGSCSSKKNLSFSFRLIMALPETIDYVIVHELAHLKEMNHSKKFWAEVDKMNEKIGLKNYKVYKKWLRENGRKINFE